MVLLMLAIFCCCVPMAMPMQHVVAYCGDLGFASQYGAAMLSVLLGSAFLARQFWGWLCDRIGGLQTLVWSSLAQMTALTGFLLTQDQAALFVVSAAFGFGLSGLVPAYVIVVRDSIRSRKRTGASRRCCSAACWAWRPAAGAPACSSTGLATTCRPSAGRLASTC